MFYKLQIHSEIIQTDSIIVIKANRLEDNSQLFSTYSYGTSGSINCSKFDYYVLQLLFPGTHKLLHQLAFFQE